MSAAPKLWLARTPGELSRALLYRDRLAPSPYYFGQGFVVLIHAGAVGGGDLCDCRRDGADIVRDAHAALRHGHAAVLYRPAEAPADHPMVRVIWGPAHLFGSPPFTFDPIPEAMVPDALPASL